MLVSLRPINMYKTAGDLQRVLGQVAKDDYCLPRLLMEEYKITLSNVSNVSDKRYGLKIVGKPCEGKPHARFDEGLLGRSWPHQRPTLRVGCKPC